MAEASIGEKTEGNDLGIAKKCFDELKNTFGKRYDKNQILHVSNPAEYIIDVMVSPWAKDYYVDLVEEICIKNGITFAGKSQLLTM